MAAKPPKPPTTFLKQSSHNNNEADNDNNGNSNNSNPSTSAATAAATPTTPTSAATHAANAETYSKLGIKRYNSRENLLNNIANDYNYNENDTETKGNSLEGAVAAAARPACNCTNISIMHLFHEMKQEFPTIPDPIVAQCVNDNCHQRENCIQMLRNELALNPIPVQTYPAKVLQQHHINNQQHSNLQQQKQLQQRQKSPQQPAQTPHTPPQPPQRLKNASPQKPATPLRPTRAAPTQPPSTATLQRVRGEIKNSAVTPHANCDSVELVQNSNNLAKDVNSVQLPGNNSNNNSAAGDSPKQACDMPVTATATANAPVECARSADFITALNRIAANHQPSTPQLPATGARARPNTLNLQATQQQLQRQQLNKQLQQHLQQRSQLKQQQQPASGVAAEPPLQKPIRKAPLPPIAPKPVFHNNISYNNNSSNNNNNNSGANSPQWQSIGSCSSDSALTSPLSSCGESEVSVNAGCSPSQAFALSHINNNLQNNNINNNNNVVAPTYQAQQTSPLRSPIRHRSVITVQPEPPYARDFLPSAKINTVGNSTAGGSGGSTPTSQKSFTSVNLTLRQPTNAVPQSTIDISAGPVLSGNGSGLTYSSTSYNARHGFQQNFHITVTEEGGVFNASRIRPRNNSAYYAGIEGVNTADGPTGGTGQTTTTSQQQQQTPTTILLSPTAQSAQFIAPPAPLTTASSEDMCLPLENSAFIETIKRQKARRDKLASALRENKNKLGNVEEEVKMLTEPLNPGESERLDYEIERLRTDCQQTLNEIENIRRYGQLSEDERLKQQQQQQQQQQQAFPRWQRPPRPPPPQQQPQSPYQQYQPTEVDFQQQQYNTPGSVGSTAGIVGVIGSGHSSAAGTPNSPRLQQTPPTQRVNYVGQPPPYQLPSTDEEDYSDSNTDGGDDYEPLERWPCSMCTFLNHPQLNICEACECVRIIPGTIRIVPTAGGSASAAAAAAVMPQPLPAATTAGGASATAAAAAAALTAATPTAIAHGASNASAGNSPTSAARTVAAE
ncbi:PREDICTED: putative mediator of RNA polymerase II transcription subunit 26 isoform X1 [Bactrocera latifrons]|uniref:putative mediator of RNA polymerase II transcription subunit 26 isoform X1 n=1 Tax=Bactrocera latifrons TaxID=174628 RepID=UPI0008DC6E8D|nr:PREDICTED: putative mediator of RNA polymerase II transcription subunit 26 isoform X1 [Bactrocera latifrons]XP_018802109.1 PREDICTED: putative mediator of RNA polymerase II transcription subunit 26 isoform X1 [Bactrocera latifrons]XP_018802110.1 PREDICTED: putative mediator of RNA polymerase II transcription subunit 26 isoform X1 [Bactrocera latifrons]